MNHTELMGRTQMFYDQMLVKELKGQKESVNSYKSVIRKYTKVLRAMKAGFEDFINHNPDSKPAMYLKGEVYKIEQFLKIVEG